MPDKLYENVVFYRTILLKANKQADLRRFVWFNERFPPEIAVEFDSFLPISIDSF
jgi:hypothetical protein